MSTHRMCTCGHAETSHDLNARKVRTRCSHIGPDGPCGCARFRAAVAP